MKLNRALYLLMLSIAAVGCKDTSEMSAPVASVGDVVMTRAQLIAALPMGMTSEDSAVIADEFVRRWVNQQVVVQKAELNLSEEEIDIEEAIEEYRRALLVERYQQKLIEKKFKPVITEKEIEEYYEEMKENFKLNESIMKGLMAVLPKDSPDKKNFMKNLKFEADEDYGSVEKYLYDHSKTYTLSLDKWITISSVKRFIPIEKQPTDQQLAQKKLFEYTDEETNNTYLLYVSEIKTTDETAPMEYVKDKISTVLLNKKKIEFIKQLSANLYDEAMKNNTIKFYYTNE